ncbi:ABC transporter permease [Hymenobacter sp. UV11]|uniref:ABC transporter permease n=1 Tax=Hymenobacter sp. UV11 TaxID=1849735 RepID=UPI00105BC3F2|nr:ABC transporter permease [Hymenobacter sp. UV11]TDN35828.1 ABC transporter permease [Hymenobacter sp. UV11]TFZ67440.1 ABC transporter permease [Hymenobacter sp. UV11]
MDKIWLIIQREYLTRVRKKSFLVISLLAPLLLAGTTIAVSKLNSASGPDVVAVHDASGLQVAAHLTDTDEIHFVPATPGTLAQAQAAFEKAKPKQAALLSFPAGFGLDSAKGTQILAKGNVSLNRQNNIRKAVNKAIGELKMARSGLKQETIDNLQAKVDLAAINLDELGGKRNDVGTTTAMAYFLSILVYMFIFIYGVQVMRGVSEEKSNRIMEVMISSVKPFQLMMGKILGIAGVVLTQFALWLVLSWGITTVVMPLLLKNDKPTTTITTNGATVVRPAAPASSPAVAATSPAGDQAAVATPQPGHPFSIWSVLDGLPIGSIIGGFLFYFLGGYLLYSAMFAAIGSAVDDQTDAQQFMFPVTIPLILSYIVSINVIINGDPNGPLAFWLSMIPFTSPIAMVMRLPFGVPTWQLVLSGALLIVGFVGVTWVAARIYRVGILMYGKKVTYSELSKWMFYKG